MVRNSTIAALFFTAGVLATITALAYRFASMEADEYERFTTELGRIKHVEVENPERM